MRHASSTLYGISNQGLLLYAECPAVSPERQGRRVTAGDRAHWTTKWEKWPAFTSSFKNSFTSCQIPLWPGTCTGAAGQDRAWVHRPCWPGSYQPDPAHRSNRQLILLCQGFLAALLFFFFSPPPFSTLSLVCSWQRVGDYQSAWNPTFALLYNYCTECAPKSISRED